MGVCGTDLHIHNGDFNAAFPLIPGHELVGTVESIGSGVTRVKVGEQVSVNPNVNCGLCDYCLGGNPIRCTALQGLGSNFPGFFADYVVVPERLVFSTEGLPIDTAVFTEPAACATHGLERLKIWPGSSALVFGAGPTGLLLAQLIKSGGAASVTVAAPTQFKLDRAHARSGSTRRSRSRGPIPSTTSGSRWRRPAAAGTTSSSRRPARPSSATSACR